jgi:hypothetical protein
MFSENKDYFANRLLFHTPDYYQIFGYSVSENIIENTQEEKRKLTIGGLFLREIFGIVD